jgi:imidazolonepropionase-like amidohydrolase
LSYASLWQLLNNVLLFNHPQFLDPYDTVIQNGVVIDTLSKVEIRADVAIKDGKVAAIEPHIASDQAADIVDATDQYVCPGLIDMHTHVYWGATYWGIEADALAATTGVTVSTEGEEKAKLKIDWSGYSFLVVRLG